MQKSMERFFCAVSSPAHGSAFSKGKRCEHFKPKKTKKMRKNMTYLAVLLLVGAASMMTAEAQSKPTLAVFVVGGDNTLVTPLTTALRTNLTSSGRYVLTSVDISGKLTELQNAYTAGGGSSINRNALAEWGRDNSISAICLVIDDVKGSDHLFSAQLIDTKNSKLSGKGSHVRTGVAVGDVARVSLALAKQLEGTGRVARRDITPQQKWFEPEMVRVEGGTFTMGCTPEQENCADNEKPVHSVTVSNFYIGKYEVTREQWLMVMAGHPTLADPCTDFRGDNQLPMCNVSWNDINGKDGFLERLNALTGKNYRLPTEAEWEYAARGGKHKSPYKYSGSNNADLVAWHPSNSGSPRIVGGKNPNALGIYDMSGNIWEICHDRLRTYSSEAQTNPIGTSGNLRAINGGCYGYGGINGLRNSFRYTWVEDNTHYSYYGFRLALPTQ
jgi:formylglycine-generating enzyme required for sulfatase activity